MATTGRGLRDPPHPLRTHRWSRPLPPHSSLPPPTARILPEAPPPPRCWRVLLKLQMHGTTHPNTSLAPGSLSSQARILLPCFQALNDLEPNPLQSAHTTLPFPLLPSHSLPWPPGTPGSLPACLPPGRNFTDAIPRPEILPPSLLPTPQHLATLNDTVNIMV